MQNSKHCAWHIGLAFENMWLLQLFLLQKEGVKGCFTFTFFTVAGLQFQSLPDICHAIGIPKT